MSRADFHFVLPYRVRYADSDAQRIVFYGNYLTFFDNAITDYLRPFGYRPLQHPEETGADFHVVKVELDYRASVALDEEIDICARIERIGRSSLTFRCEVHPKDGDDLRVGGTIVWVYTDQTTHKSTPLPPTYVAGMEKLEGRKLTG